MTKFVRKNLLVFRSQFVDEAGAIVVPTSAHLSLAYTAINGAPATRTIDLVNVAGFWTGQWDTSDCKSGRVEWVAYCEGAIQAATQGAFEVAANKANTV